MCKTKKLCTCDSIKKGQDHWVLEFCYGQYPSWGIEIDTRPEHKKLAQDAATRGNNIIGPMPIPLFKDLYKGIADKSLYLMAVDAEEAWLNEGNPFDFEYEPFDGDRLMFAIGGQRIAYSYFNGQWTHKPHQQYSQDDRMRVDENTEDLRARNLAKTHLA